MSKINKDYILFVLLSGLFIRLVVAITNAFLFPTLGGANDALVMHDYASYFALTGDIEANRLNEVGWFYALVLGYIYSFSFNSLFFGCLLSILAWLISALVILRLLDLLRFNNQVKFYAMLIFALFPSSFFYTSITLREPFQMLFLTLLLYSMVRFYLTNSVLHFLNIPIWAIALAFLHQVLIAISIVALGVFIVFSSLIGLKRRLIKVRFYFVLIISICLIPIAFYLINEYGYSLEKGLVSAVSLYQEGLIGDGSGARAFYRFSSIDENIGSFLLFLPTAFIQYQLEPLPWRMGSITDLLFFIENCVRVYLMYLSVKFLIINKSKQRIEVRSSLLLILFIYFFTELIWSLGTMNWGTASRHHIPSLGLLAIVAAPGLVNSWFVRDFQDNPKAVTSL